MVIGRESVVGVPDKVQDEEVSGVSGVSKTFVRGESVVWSGFARAVRLHNAHVQSEGKERSKRCRICTARLEEGNPLVRQGKLVEKGEVDKDVGDDEEETGSSSYSRRLDQRRGADRKRSRSDEEMEEALERGDW